MSDEKPEYPLSEEPDEIEAATGKELSEVTLDAVMDGEVEESDLVISEETLERQAEIAEEDDRPQMAWSVRRAAELTAIPDEKLLEIYNALRPSGADKQKLLELADELEAEYDAELNAEFVREAVEAYEQRDTV